MRHSLPMYTITGADGREYGPVTADQIRQWIIEGRANAQTKVRAEGSADWKLLTEFPEFAPQAAVQPATSLAPAPFPIGPSSRTNSMATAGMVLGILSLTLACCCYGLPFNVAGIICSSIALSQIKKGPVNYQGRGMAIAGLVLSILSIVLAGLLLAFGAASNWSNIFRKIQRL